MERPVLGRTEVERDNIDFLLVALLLALAVDAIDFDVAPSRANGISESARTASALPNGETVVTLLSPSCPLALYPADQIDRVRARRSGLSPGYRRERDRPRHWLFFTSRRTLAAE